ncbi:MAG: dicarboxylate/amino acid:cation symporter [Chlamydiia bacterium]|nr:dicarboxylate/amino acid:cation symporter [Chlamydiia bacterium]
MQKKHNAKKPWTVFIAILLAIAVGCVIEKETLIWKISVYDVFDTIGNLFLNALTLVVVPLVSSSIISGIARMGGDGNFGRLGAKMFFFYLTTSLAAILIGLFFVNLIGPGQYETPVPVSDTIATQLSTLKEQVTTNSGATFLTILQQIIPSNILMALSKGHMLSLIFFSLLFGYCITKIDSQPATTLNHFFQGIFQTMIRFTQIVMKVLPIGVFCLIAKVFMTTGISSLKSVALFFVTVLLALAAFTFIALPLFLRLIAQVSPLKHFRAMAPALITAFSTSSSSATLPITIDCVEKRAGVSNRICSLVVPLGTSINMSGSALYECVAAMFVAQAYGIHLDFPTQFLVVLMALITSIGVAGIPSASLVAILVILKVIGLPPEGLGLFIAVDRILDMCRTTVNVFSDSCCAVLVAKSEGEKNVLVQEVNLSQDS